MVEIQNVKRADMIFSSLLERTRSENVGIGLFYGCPGLGKSRWAKQTAIRDGHVYLRLIENMTSKDFLKELLHMLKYKHLHADSMYGTQKELYEQILSILQTNEDLVIFVDEIEYGFTKPKILATIRDLADQSICTFVLVGMQNAKSQLTKMNAHYFDRCNGFCEFKPLNLQDVDSVLKEVSEVDFDQNITEFIFKKSNGTMRLINKYVEVLEKFAKKRKMTTMQYSDVNELLEMMEVS
jgi:Holliday junction resolvasome RuvABC ATP-dependent DNA helicase subunit